MMTDPVNLIIFQRSPLEQLVLKVKLLDLGSPAQTLMLALQPPPLTDVRKTILLLKEVIIKNCKLHFL